MRSSKLHRSVHPNGIVHPQRFTGRRDAAGANIDP
jgi:hypothetical protein